MSLGKTFHIFECAVLSEWTWKFKSLFMFRLRFSSLLCILTTMSFSQIHTCILLNKDANRFFSSVKSQLKQSKIFDSVHANIINQERIRTLKKPILGYSETIKKSKFVVFAGRITTEKEAEKFLQSHFDEKATHHCYAFRISSCIYRACDDGEPSGTAGKPILSAIDGHSLQQVMVVVRRYYGGIKLGSGLVRAYGQTARNALQFMATSINKEQKGKNDHDTNEDNEYFETIYPTVKLSVTLTLQENINNEISFTEMHGPQTAVIYRLARLHSGEISTSDDSSDSVSSFVISLPNKNVAQFVSELHNLTKGQVLCSLMEEENTALCTV